MIINFYRLQYLNTGARWTPIIFLLFRLPRGGCDPRTFFSPDYAFLVVAERLASPLRLNSASPLRHVISEKTE